MKPYAAGALKRSIGKVFKGDFMERLKYWFWLCMISEIGIRTIDRLIEFFGDVEELFFCRDEIIRELPWLNGKQKDKLISSRSAEAVESAYESMQKQGISFISFENDAYPEKLKHIFEYPKGLFYIGKLPENNYENGSLESCHAAVAVVGARYCTNIGRTEAEHFAEVMAGNGIHIISGMALGIDAAAHRGALKADGMTTAVLGCGADRCYPEQNRGLYGQIKREGCIISEYPPGAAPLAWHFPRRNRILSGLSDGVLVVEARQKSGSLITAGFALEQGKDVFAVPGRGCDVLSKGCNNLIRQGAFLVDKPEEILDYYHIPVRKAKKNNIRLAKSENMVYSSLCLTPKYIEEICVQTALPVGDILSALFRLEKAGLIVRLGAQQYMVKQTQSL